MKFTFYAALSCSLKAYRTSIVCTINITFTNIIRKNALDLLNFFEEDRTKIVIASVHIQSFINTDTAIIYIQATHLTCPRIPSQPNPIHYLEQDYQIHSWRKRKINKKTTTIHGWSKNRDKFCKDLLTRRHWVFLRRSQVLEPRIIKCIFGRYAVLRLQL